MQTYTIYANLSESVTLVCEQCRRNRALRAAAVKDLPQPLKVQCPCGATFGVNVIIRQFYRKKTRLPGTYVKHDPRTNKILERARMIVEDISQTGLGLCTLCTGLVFVATLVVWRDQRWFQLRSSKPA